VIRVRERWGHRIPHLLFSVYIVLHLWSFDFHCHRPCWWDLQHSLRFLSCKRSTSKGSGGEERKGKDKKEINVEKEREEKEKGKGSSVPSPL